MDNRRPSLDRSRETGAKKPRIASDMAVANANGRQVLPCPGSAGGAMSISAGPNRYWGSNERTSDRAEAYQPQPQLHHELVNQYKMALAELTFNSKPIITNLTIIAGENLHAAKAIAATICLNILEVPSDQKLPSLYLLDSIVKNIGRDYIRYFAARLPEVFLKTYRQIDPSLHQSMRHLFGTWKGVFPPQTLQVIEKEIRSAAPISNSNVQSNRPDPQSQRPQHSIHVNPKYLERQRLNSKVKGMPSDGDLPHSNSTMEVEKVDKSPENGRQWVDRIHLQRDVSNGQHSEKRALYEDYEIGRITTSRNERASGKLIDTLRGKNSFVGSSKDVNQSTASQSNGVTSKHGIFNIEAARSSARISNWKNSDEEEFMWNLHPRAPDNDVISASASSRKDIWGTNELEKFETDDISETRCLPNSLPRFDRDGSSDSTENKEAFPAKPSSWGLLDSQSDDNLIDTEISVPGITFSEHYSSILDNKSSKLPPSHKPVSGTRGRLVDHKASPLDHAKMQKLKRDDRQSVFSQHGPAYSSKPVCSDSLATEDSRKSTTSDLLAAVMESGVLSNIKPLEPKIETTKDEHPKGKPPSAAPISNLLSSLVAKGLITTVDPDVSDQKPSMSKKPMIVSHRSSSICSASATPAVSDSNTEDISSNLAGKTSEFTPTPEILIGLQFKSDVLRELHPNVISSLSEDLPHQCTSCSMRFRVEGQLSRHLYCHSLKDLKQETSYRKWYVDACDWSVSPVSVSKPVGEEEPTVIADDEQCVCILCGEIFDDYYKNGTWMFKGAVRLPVLKQETATKEHYRPIVHSTCFLVSSAIKKECDVE